MHADFSPPVGFQPSRRVRGRRGIAVTELLLTLALALSTAIAVTAVSIGMARADTLGTIVADESGPVGVALLLGAVLAVMGGLTTLVTRICDATDDRRVPGRR
jgi:hypothetical protein